MNNSSPLSITVSPLGLSVEGELNFNNAANLKPSLLESISTLPAAFTVDLTRISQFNSSVLPVMLDCLRIAQAQNKHCSFTGITPALSNMLKMASLSDLG